MDWKVEAVTPNLHGPQIPPQPLGLGNTASHFEQDASEMNQVPCATLVPVQDQKQISLRHC